MSARIGLYPGRRGGTPPAEQPGLTTRQAGELARIQARYGRCRVFRDTATTVTVVAVGDIPGREPTLTVRIDRHGTPVWAHGTPRADTTE